MHRLQLALNALGFRCEMDGELSDTTVAAISEFQRNYRLPVTGQPDAETLEVIARLKHAWEGKDYLI